MRPSQSIPHPARWATLGLALTLLSLGCDPGATVADAGMMPDANTGTDGGMMPDAAADASADGALQPDGSSEHSQTIIPGDRATMVDIDLHWDADGVELVIDGPDVNWQLGIAETDAGNQGWTGESCGGETMFDADVCHSIDPDGGRVASVHPDVDRVDDGFTLFNASFAPALTYILHAAEPIRYAFDCIVWGHDPGYYGEFGCVLR